MKPLNNPWEILGLPPQASDAEIRAAYLRLLHVYPPDRAPKEFERLRDAYDTLRDPRRRATHRLLAKPGNVTLEEYFMDSAGGRPYIGPEPWLKFLKEG